MTEVVSKSAGGFSEMELADQRKFSLPPAQWNAFLEALNQPTQSHPELRRLLTEPSVIELANQKNINR